RNRGKESAAVRRKLAELFPPGSAEAYYNLGQACRLVGDFQTARAHFEKCLSIAPSEYFTHAEAHQDLGLVLGALGENDRALAAFGKALDSPRVESDILADIYINRGNIYFDQENYAAAVSDYNIAIELQPLGHIYKRRGLAHFRLQHYEQALADIAKVVELN